MSMTPTNVTTVTTDDNSVTTCDNSSETEEVPSESNNATSEVVPKRPKTGGRKKGSKNKSTLLKEALRGEFEELLTQDFKKILRVVADQALDGCRQSQKLILDRVVPTVHAESDSKDKHKFSSGITIQIGSMESKAIDVQANEIVDGDFTEIDTHDT